MSNMGWKDWFNSLWRENRVGFLKEFERFRIDRWDADIVQYLGVVGEGGRRCSVGGVTGRWPSRSVNFLDGQSGISEVFFPLTGASLESPFPPAVLLSKPSTSMRSASALFDSNEPCMRSVEERNALN